MLNLEINPIFGLGDVLTFKKGGGIHIKKKNRGKFTKSAKAAGESVLEHAAHVLSDPNATPLLKKRANFARNAAKWKHQLGGTLKLTPEEKQYLAWSKLSPELKLDMTEFVAIKPSLIKLSNAITRDNNGKIIPISKRNNFLNNDIRYKKGGKTHKPFGHRSVLDNGWQSTKLLKNKKNVYNRYE